jgi:hypothetical protein
MRNAFLSAVTFFADSEPTKFVSEDLGSRAADHS